MTMDSSIRNTLMGGPAMDQDQRHAFQIAFYNTVLFALLGICLLGLYAIYQMLYMFLTPLLWAILVGTVIFPLKRHISATLGGWLEHLDEENTPLVVGVAVLPLGVASRISNTIYDTAFSQTGTLCAAAYLALKILSFDGVLAAIFNRLGRFYTLVDAGIDFFTQKWVAILLLPYVVAYLAYIYVQDSSRLRKKPTRILSLPIWYWNSFIGQELSSFTYSAEHFFRIFLLSHLSNFFGLLRVLIFISTATLLVLISAGLIAVSPKPGEEASNEVVGEVIDIAVGENKTDPRDSQLKHSPTVSSFDESRLDKALSGDNHLRIVAALCLLLLIAKYDVLLIIILVPFFAAAAMRVGERVGLNDVVEGSIQQVWQWMAEKLEKPINIVVAGSLRKFVTLLFTSDRMFISGLKGRVDFIATQAVMVGLAVGTVLTTLFVCFQIHNETVHLVRLGKEVLTSHPEWISTALNYTEGQLREHDIDQYIDKAYQQGREWLSSNIRSIADPKDPGRADQLEQQVNLLLDNLYRLWGDRNNASAGCTDGQTAVTRHGTEGDWMKQIMSATNIETLRKELTAVISQNLETIIQIARSIWGVVLANLSLLTTVLLSIAWFVLGFGLDLFNLFIEAVVFLTVVYYLLANSSDEWLPLKWFNNLIPSLSQMSNIKKTDRESIGQAMENAISGVFVLSAKMSIFYALHTYFVHSLFGLHIVFIPSMLASLFASVPIVPPYAVCLLGFIELFLVRGESFAGITFVLLSIAPLFVADAAFYREIKGSHPYVTGLAVIGGIYWMGVTGAIIGPIILCCMLTLINLYSELATRGGE